jgi:gluconolactonase
VLISRTILRRRGRTESGGGSGAGAEDDHDDPVGGSDDDVIAIEWQKLRPPQSMTMPAGAARYPGGGMVFCSQGSLTEGSTGGLYFMPRGKPPEALVTGFYGRQFNSPHDITISTRDRALWFTDPCRGFDLGFRPRPLLPCRVYRFHPESGDLRVVVDGLVRPMGIAFSADESTVYITDAGAVKSEGDVDSPR